MTCETVKNESLKIEQKRDKMKSKVLALTDKQAEYVLERIRKTCVPK